LAERFEVETKDILQSVLEELSVRVKYADFRSVRQSETEIALRAESFEMSEDHFTKVSCRVLDEGYGVAATDRPDGQKVKALAEFALKQARSVHTSVSLAPVKPEQGEYTHPLKKPVNSEEARRLLLHLSQAVRSKLGNLYHRSELVLSHSIVESDLLTSEGTSVTERAGHTNLIIYLVARNGTVGYASKIVGGKGGLEAVDDRDWDGIISEVVTRARDSSKAQLLSPFARGKHKVILDPEAAGVLAHEVAHMLEADNFQMRFFQGLRISEDFEIVDDPGVPGAYGSFAWDDEGVRGSKKALLKRGSLQLLHTRATAGERGMPGNAHGITHMPKPSMSNVYIEPSDWNVKEMFEETGSGIYVRGVVGAETDLSDGRFELTPEIAYLIENKEAKTPIKHLKIQDNVRNIIQRIDAIGKITQIRPNVEKGFGISEGGPHVRISGVQCS